MNIKKNFTIAVLLIAGIATAISISSSQIDTPVMEKDGIKLYEVKGSENFPDAELSLTEPVAGSNLMVGTDTFVFDVKNYKLGAQTPDAAQKLCANSAKGQHIHFILDNAPYVASYSNRIGADIKRGHHVLLSFLSRSYHESLKHKKAYILAEFNVGAGAVDDFDEKAPHIFASRPKGEYIGEQETRRVMLDFYLINCDLSANGYKVRATINGKQFTITKWQPYLIEGLPLGESKIKLELLDKKGKPVNSPYNGTERTITLKNDPSR